MLLKPADAWFMMWFILAHNHIVIFTASSYLCLQCIGQEK